MWTEWMGAWALVPGAPGAVSRATCALVPEGDGASFWIAWTNADGAEQVARGHVDVAGVVDAPGFVGARIVVDGDGLVITQVGGAVFGVFVRAPVKQVIVYRRDLTMRKGKIAAQVAHASMKALLALDEGAGPRFVLDLPGPMAVWARGSFAKVVLSVEDEAALDAVYAHARAAGLPAARITDSGRTEFKGVPTRTTVAVGPWTADEIDKVTGPGGLVETKLA
jgi:PTH2 family peptidyl-tRNA hydrolase